MEIEVGEYVRTIDGYIRKVEQVNRKGSYDGLCHGAYNVDTPYKYSQGISAKKIKAHSKDIIDLIEEGDFVNREYVLHIDTNIESYGEKTIITELNNRYFGSQIINIVTKEQFKSVECIVKE